MKKWLIGLTLVLAACGSENGEPIDNGNDNAETMTEEPVNEASAVEEDEVDQVSASPLTLPSEITSGGDGSSVMRYERDGIVPHRIEIPAIGVDAIIEEVGLLPGGQMDEPTEMDEVAWYEGGYMPGEQGSAVLAGHVDSRTGPAIFIDLEKLEAGDEIIVTDEEGTEKVFVVQNSESYDRNDAPLQTIFGYSYRSQLNLITCTGEFNTEAGTHDERLVVYSVLKEDLN
ncbi:class F sortase [Salisediminibacterium beveridgei]|uniref:LPXTG-site transpeptidase (Sortase) family protein n=1 Tax=Salisediminibacterium beveridgei TaxID=632773 RepID=A0A1D7QYL5_9BACI|nr:class F sortase [Salisediminibacterium beveridgei]AOM84092.1 hypothetical protein BBEV_2755 [Salisediminibacterium beveridgei]